eukprot:s1620_g21.t1
MWGSKVSFFLYGTLVGAGPKNQSGHNLRAINETNRTALKIALSSLRPEAVEFVENAEDVTEENIAQYVLHQECFRDIQFTDPVDGVAFFENRLRFLRGLNQLAHVISSLEMMMRFEKARGRRFKVVILTRPDMRYDVSRDVAWVPKWVSKGKVALQMDFWVAVPRALAERFFLLGKILTCSPSDHFCCRKIDRSESLWEYLTGAVHSSKGCKCSNITTPWKKVKVGKIQRTLTPAAKKRRMYMKVQDLLKNAPRSGSSSTRRPLISTRQRHFEAWWKSAIFLVV